MAYYILKSYKSEMFQPLNSYATHYILMCDKFSFFGLIRKEVKIPYAIPDHAYAGAYFKKWDGMIESREKFKAKF